MKLERKVNKYRNVCLVCTDLGRNSELKLSVKSWYETFKDGNGSKALKELVFNKSEDTGILATYSNSTLDSLTTDDTLIFCCEIQCEGSINEADESDPEEAEKELAYRKKVEQTMLELHSSGYSDVVIQVENKEFKTSKIILMANSGVFQRMFSCSRSTEAQTGIVKIEDEKPNVIEALLRWICQVEISNMNEVAEGLYRTADKYEIDLLKEKCAKAMIKSLSNENLLPRLILAYKHSDEKLKKRVLEFLREDSKNVQSLMASDEWIKFAVEDPDLRKEIVADIFESLF